MGTFTLKHSINSGDLVAAMAGIRHLYRRSGKKSVIYQRLDMPGQYYQGAVHPVKDDQGTQVTMNERQWEMLKPLLEAQEYIDHCEEWVGQPVDINLDQLLEGNFANKPYGIIQRWPFYVIPSMACDLSESWLEVNEDATINTGRQVIINYTQRYRNHLISYFFLEKYKDTLVFAGTKEEHESFNKMYKLDLPYLQVNNFLDLAKAIKAAPFFAGNQSMCYQIAEAMKTPRLLELCTFAPNTFPIGPDGYDYFNQASVEYYFETLMK